MFWKKQQKITISDKQKKEITIQESGKKDETPKTASSKKDSQDIFLLKILHNKKLYGFLAFSSIALVVFLFFTKKDKKSNPNTSYLPPTKELQTPKFYANYELDRWVLEADMLDLITQDSSQSLFISWNLLQQIEEILSWSIGLRNLNKGDIIHCIWKIKKDQTTDTIVHSEMVGLQIQSSSIDTTLYAIQFTPKEGSSDFYDQEGRIWKRQFLRSPVKYGRISSRFNLTRLNPVLKKIKAHKGTDYAAPLGAEIYALADGVIIQQGHGPGNGNYIVIQHDSIYKTAYLHMNQFNDAYNINDTIQQGTVIGYVGSTGSSTGPHVCLRFWRRTLQDDFVQSFPHLPTPTALPYQERIRFFQKRDSIIHAIQLFNKED